MNNEVNLIICLSLVSAFFITLIFYSIFELWHLVTNFKEPIEEVVFDKEELEESELPIPNPYSFNGTSCYRKKSLVRPHSVGCGDYVMLVPGYWLLVNKVVKKPEGVFLVGGLYNFQAEPLESWAGTVRFFPNLGGEITVWEKIPESKI